MVRLHQEIWHQTEADHQQNEPHLVGGSPHDKNEQRNGLVAETSRHCHWKSINHMATVFKDGKEEASRIMKANRNENHWPSPTITVDRTLVVQYINKHMLQRLKRDTGVLDIEYPTLYRGNLWRRLVFATSILIDYYYS